MNPSTRTLTYQRPGSGNLYHLTLVDTENPASPTGCTVRANVHRLEFLGQHLGRRPDHVLLIADPWANGGDWGTVEGLNKRASDEYLRFNAVWCLELGGPELALSDVLL